MISFVPFQKLIVFFLWTIHFVCSSSFLNISKQHPHVLEIFHKNFSNTELHNVWLGWQEIFHKNFSNTELHNVWLGWQVDLRSVLSCHSFKKTPGATTLCHHSDIDATPEDLILTTYYHLQPDSYYNFISSASLSSFITFNPSRA